MTFTAAASGLCAPGAGVCEITRPRVTVAEYACPVLPGSQCALVSAARAPAAVLPLGETGVPDAARAASTAGADARAAAQGTPASTRPGRGIVMQ